MSNYSELELAPEEAAPDDLSDVERCVWLTGITLSAACFITQMLLFVFLPKIRKLDQKILAQLTLARLVNTIVEYLVVDQYFTENTRFVIFMLYLQTDIVLIFWMFVFTKNLYDKVVQVFVLQSWNFLLVSVLVWLVALPLGALSPTFLTWWPDYYYNFYNTYAIVKFIVLCMNLLFFCVIFYVIFNRNRKMNSQFTTIIRICIIAFVLVNITSVQVLLTDITSFFTDDLLLTNTFCLISSFHALIITSIFIILVKNAC